VKKKLFPDDRIKKIDKEIEKTSAIKGSKSIAPKPQRKSKKEREKEGRSVGPILLVITIIISYLIILLS